MKRDAKFYTLLFFTTFQLSAFTFGGGYVIVPLMKKQFVEKLAWIDEKEMLDFAAIAQATPGPMAVNAATLLGYHLAGIKGALVAIFGTVLPPFILLSVISLFYTAFAANPIVKNVLRAMQAAVSAVILDVVFGMAGSIIQKKQLIAFLLMIAAFLASAFFEVDVITIILVCAAVGLLSTLISKRKAKGTSDDLS
ncbi:MAG: chromate transporter [Negativicutes bacterium]|nr:chromate transporter [Negativicutes bacterium]